MFSRTSTIPAEEFQTQSDWAKFLCIAVAGFIEKSLNNILNDIFLEKTSGPFQNYLVHHSNKIQNPKSSKICEILSILNPDWSEEISRFMDDNGRREAIDGVMVNRHLIAHGRIHDANQITIARIREYYAKSYEVIKEIEIVVNR